MTDALLRASIGGAIAVAVVWTIGRLAPRLSPAVRTTLWWLAAAKFLIGIVWISPIELRVLSAPSAPTVHVATSADNGSDAFGSGVASTPAPPRIGNVEASVLVVWVSGALIAFALGARQRQRASTIVQTSRPASDELNALALNLADRLRLARVPSIRESELIDTPLVTGLRRPTIIVPRASFHLLSLDQQRMALCHELAHVKRADLPLGAVPALAERLFFFHPLVHVASREYSIWREAACDRDVLDALDAAPDEYGQLLVDLGVSNPRAGLAAAGASWSFTSLKRRLTMLTESPNRSRSARALAFVAVGAAALTLVPLTLTARPAAVPESVVPLFPQVVEKPKPIEQSGKPELRLNGEVLELRKEPGLRLVMFAGGDETLLRGEPSDVTHAMRLRAGDEKLLWFRLGDAEYVSRSADALKQFQDAWKANNVVTAYTPDPENLLRERKNQYANAQAELANAKPESAEGQKKLELASRKLQEMSDQIDEIEAKMKRRAANETTEPREIRTVGPNMSRIETLLRRFADNGVAARVK